MKVNKIGSNIFHFDFEDQVELSKTFVRFQEHYESPKFKDKIFTLGEYRDWYAKEYGDWTYYTDWDGFNFPDYILRPFVDGLFDPLTKEEKLFLDKLKAALGVLILDKYYVIGSYMSDRLVIEHELCHALYYLNPDYRLRVRQQLSEYDLSDARDYLLKDGYHSDVVLDEMNAYIVSSRSDVEEALGRKIPDSLYDSLASLKNIFMEIHS